MKRLILCFLLALVLVWVGRVQSAPAINTWEVSNYVLVDDTLPQMPQDSVITTAAIPVFGARLIYMTVKTTGSDSLAVPTVQTSLPGGTAFTGAGGTSFVPGFIAMNTTAPLTATTTITSTTRLVAAWYNEQSASGGTPLPLVNDYWRFRLKSSDTRRPNPPYDHLPTPSGRYTIILYVCR